MQRLDNPYPLWLDLRGGLLDAGYVYVGTAGEDPEASPVAVFWNSTGSTIAEQPLRTRGGYVANGANPAFAWVSATDYSLRVRDSDGNLIFYTASVAASGMSFASFQPLDPDLTLIAALSTTDFGRSLLTMANAAAAKSALGVVNGLASTGGVVTGNITRSGSGPHIFHADGAMTSGRLFVTASGASDPTSLPGDLWIKTA